ncbi:MAG: cyclase family protein [Desulfobacteraceae bacterium]|jgi:kynurenine formamidase
MVQEKNKWIYLSYPLSKRTPAYGGGESLEIRQNKSLEKGDSCNTSNWRLSNHLGTHIDFPRHFVSHGKTSTDYSPEFWIFSLPFLCDISNVEPGLVIKPDMIDFSSIPEHIDILMIKTGFSIYREKEIYWEKNPGFSPGFADVLRRNFPDIKIFGFDSISLSSFANRATGREAHKAFLDNTRPILLLEDMDLSLINNEMEIKQIIVSPLRVEDTNGAPCNVFASITRKVTLGKKK